MWRDVLVTLLYPLVLDIDAQIVASEALKSLPEANTLIHVAKRVNFLEMNQ